jgi:hypothetical protein
LVRSWFTLRLSVSKREHTTILLVEQNFRIAEAVGDDVAVMDEGRIIHTGEMAALAANHGLQHRAVRFIRLQPGRNVLHVVGHFARTYSDKRRTFVSAPPIAKAMDGYSKKARDLLGRSEIDVFGFVSHGLRLSKGADSNRLTAMCRSSAHPAPIPILGRRTLLTAGLRGPWQPFD